VNESSYQYTLYNSNSGEKFALRLNGSVIDEGSGALSVGKATFLFRKASKRRRRGD
jgi:hypothetical protein